MTDANYYFLALGTGMTLLWIMTGAFSSQVIYTDIISGAGWLITMGASLVTMAVLFALYPYLGPLIDKRVFVVSSAACSSAGILVVSMSINLLGNDPVTATIGDIVSGIGIAMMLVLVKEAMLCVKTEGQQALAFLIALMLATLLYLLLLNVSISLLVVACAAAPCIAAASLSLAHQRTQRGDLSGKAETQERVGARLLIGDRRAADVSLLLSFLALSLVQGGFNTSDIRFRLLDEWAFVFGSSTLVLVAGIVVACLLLFRGIPAGHVRLAAAVFCLAMSALRLAFPGDESLLGVFRYLSTFSFLIFILMETDRLTESPRATCMIVALLLASFLTGSAIELLAPSAIGSLIGLVWVALAGIALVASRVLAHRADSRFATPSANSPHEESGVSGMPHAAESEEDEGFSYSQRFDAVCKGMLLSDRETEVLELLLRGRSVRSIAKEKSISYNTAKTHISHIYRKADVHTREELAVLFEREIGDAVGPALSYHAGD